MSYKTILFQRQGHIALITFNRPEAMNAVNAQLALEVGSALEEFAEDTDLWVAVITGAGDKSFCAGADLKELAAGRQVIPQETAHWSFAGLCRHYVPKPIIAAVNGFAFGGGTEIALACDLVVASERASFGLQEVKRGLIAAAGGLLRLPRQIPLKVAVEAILTGDPISVEEAFRWGLVNKIVPNDQVVPAAMALAEKICTNSPVAVRASKEVIYRGLSLPVDCAQEAWEINKNYITYVKASEDFKEGTRAFAEKRKPNWKGY